MIPLDRVRALLDGVPGLWVAERADALSAAAPDLARDVLTLADALATADASIVQLRADLECADHERQRVESERDAMEDERDTARSALDGLVAAVRAEREAERGHAAVRADDASRGRHLRAAEAAVDKARHATDAILSAAPAPTTVPAAVVREYLAAVDLGPVDAYDEDSATERTQAARTALDAALAGCA